MLPTRYKLTWYEATLLLAALAAAIFCVRTLYTGFAGTAIPIMSVRQLYPDVPLVFPVDAVVVGGNRHTGFGAYLTAQIRFKRGEVHAFMSQPLLASKGTDEHSELMQWPETAETRSFHWRLKSIRKYWAIDNVECLPNDGNSQAFILIDLDNPRDVDVYLNRQYH